jgi:hypothetical protein
MAFKPGRSTVGPGFFSHYSPALPPAGLACAFSVLDFLVTICGSGAVAAALPSPAYLQKDNRACPD